MGEVIGFIALKGGVGKTTLAASLASDLVNYHGKRVLLIDANYSAPNLGLHLDIIHPEKTIHDVLLGKTRLESAIYQRYGIDVIPGNPSMGVVNPLKLRDKIARAIPLYDFVILDSSPSLNEEVLSTMLASDHLFVVTTPDIPTLSCSLRAAHLAKQRGKPIRGIIINKIRDPHYEVPLSDIEHTLGLPVIARLPDDKLQARALFHGLPLPLYRKQSPFSKEIHRLSCAMSCKPEKISFYNKLFSKHFKKEAVNRQMLKEGFYTQKFHF